MGDHSTLTRVGFIQVTKSKYQSHKWVMDNSGPGQDRTPLYTRHQKHIPEQLSEVSMWNTLTRLDSTQGTKSTYQTDQPCELLWDYVHILAALPRRKQLSSGEFIGTWDGPNNMIVFWYQRGWTVDMKKVQSKVIAAHHINSCWIETVGVTLINNLSYSIIVFGYISLAAQRERHRQ